ncbi:MAG: GNAT family N-acetyltransferase, partial [Acidimicrobiales bacterium]
ALVIPDPPASEINGLRRAMGSGAQARIAPHVTLVPPVNVSDDRMADALAVLGHGAAAVPPLHLVLGPPATFWPANPVVYLAVDGDIDDVRRLRDRLCVDPLERREHRPFVAHATIAEHVQPDRIGAALDLLSSYRAEVTVARVQLLRQQDQGADRRWDVIADAPLGGRRVVARGGLPVALTVGDLLDADAAAFFQRSWQAHLDASYGPLPAQRPFAITARREDRVVGVATGITDDELILDRLVVDAAARGQGIGRHLLAEVEGLAGSLGCTHAALICQAGGVAESWYGAHGWEVVTRMRRWRHGRDFVRMARTTG